GCRAAARPGPRGWSARRTASRRCGPARSVAPCVPGGYYCRPLAWLALIPGPAGRGRMPSLPVVGRGLITARTAAVTAGHGLDRARTTGEGPAAWLQRHPESRKDLRAATGSPDIPVP